MALTLAELKTSMSTYTAGFDAELVPPGRLKELLGEAGAIERMAAAGATITNHESVAFEWARDKDHPGFKAVSSLLKEGQPQA